MDWGEVNPTHAYYNDSRTSKDNEDPSCSTRFKTRRTQKTSSALEALLKTLYALLLYLLGILYTPPISCVCDDEPPIWVSERWLYFSCVSSFHQLLEGQPSNKERQWQQIIQLYSSPMAFSTHEIIFLHVLRDD
ncbi:hypothetical protein Tco_0038192 [Tanacetum coccineum]